MAWLSLAMPARKFSKEECDTKREAEDGDKKILIKLKRKVPTHFANIVKVTMGGSFLAQELLVRVEHDMQVELLLQQYQPDEGGAREERGSTVAIYTDVLHSGDYRHTSTSIRTCKRTKRHTHIQVRTTTQTHTPVMAQGLDRPQCCIPQNAVHAGEKLSCSSRDLRMVQADQTCVMAQECSGRRAVNLFCHLLLCHMTTQSEG